MEQKPLTEEGDDEDQNFLGFDFFDDAKSEDFGKDKMSPRGSEFSGASIKKKRAYSWSSSVDHVSQQGGLSRQKSYKSGNAWSSDFSDGGDLPKDQNGRDQDGQVNKSQDSPWSNDAFS